jgi:putative acetyltransferase
VTFKTVLPGDIRNIQIARDLFLEYEAELGIDLCFQGFEEELAALPGKYGPPSGLLLIAFDEDQPVACGALRDLGSEPVASTPGWAILKTDLDVNSRNAHLEMDATRAHLEVDSMLRVCEIKRIYVRPLARRRGLAREISNRLLDFAVEAGYDIVRLDTLRRLTGAIELYRDLGFRETGAYNYNPHEDIVYMQRDLDGAPADGRLSP